MRVLPIAGSPRTGGNSQRLLEAAVEGAREAGAEVLDALRPADLRLAPCRGCDRCQRDGVCVLHDDGPAALLRLSAADAILLAAPIYFSGLPSQLKALVDRTQVLWWRGELLRRAGTPPARPRRGYLLLCAGTHRARVFDGARETARACLYALDGRLRGELLVPDVDESGAILRRPEALAQARALGRAAALDPALP
ncbi:MAG TPA: flavodoxin family protein [Myxococcota bacterium]|nr:flavodoxin family protein [Myxococcota bacterium]HRY94349.1 flavodoxin family protein [Myxococcota bacterium]HSA22104.1 flavodoxin family protein [Myxococcota bacterium]